MRLVASLLLLAASLPAGAEAALGELFRLRDGDGRELATLPSLSGDCRHIAFPSMGQIVVLDRATGKDVLASVSPEGAPGDGDSVFPVLSDDARLVAFGSYARNLVAGPPGARFQGYLRDLAQGATLRLERYGGLASLSGDGRTLVYLDASTAGGPRGGGPRAPRQLLARDVASRTTAGVPVPGGGLPNADSLQPSLSHTGRFLAFASSASNLVPGDRGSFVDVFVLDRETGAVERISRAPDGAGADGHSDVPSLDATGRFVAFASDATNLVAGDRNGQRDVFVHDRATGDTRRLSAGPGGAETDGGSDQPALSRDGRSVAFVSWATGLVEGDRNGFADVFRVDRESGALERLSVPDGGGEADEESGTTGVVWSADGRCLAFQSWSRNLVPDAAGEAFYLRELRRPAWR